MYLYRSTVKGINYIYIYIRCGGYVNGSTIKRKLLIENVFVYLFT